MVNHTILYGRLTKAPELHTSNNGNRFCSFTVAQTERYKTYKNTVFLNCVAWGNQAEAIMKHFSKGSEITVEGRLQTNTWKDSSGNNRSSIHMEIEKFHFCGSRTTKSEAPEKAESAAAEEAAGSDDFIPDDDGDLPF